MERQSTNNHNSTTTNIHNLTHSSILPVQVQVQVGVQAAVSSAASVQQIGSLPLLPSSKHSAFQQPSSSTFISSSSSFTGTNTSTNNTSSNSNTPIISESINRSNSQVRTKKKNSS